MGEEQPPSKYITVPFEQQEWDFAHSEVSI